MPRCSIALPAEWRLRHASDSCSCSRPEICTSISACTAERRPALRPTANRRLRPLARLNDHRDDTGPLPHHAWNRTFGGEVLTAYLPKQVAAGSALLGACSSTRRRCATSGVVSAGHSPAVAGGRLGSRRGAFGVEGFILSHRPGSARCGRCRAHSTHQRPASQQALSDATSLGALAKPEYAPVRS
jgi:hypothetical protein